MTPLAPFLQKLKRSFENFMKGDGEVKMELVKRAFWKLSFPPRMLAAWPMAIVLRMVLRGLKPWIHIRFGRIWSFTLGAMAILTEIYLCERSAGMHPPRSFDLFYHYHRFAFEVKLAARPKALICNQQLDRMIRSQLYVWEGARFLHFLNGLLPGGEDFVVVLSSPYDVNGILDRFSPRLTLTLKEEERGREGLRAMGISPGAPFVCFHAKDSAWAKQGVPRIVSLYGEWFKDARRASIHNYLQAAEELTKLGYFCVRMGKFVEEPIHGDNPKIIDYATRFQSDFMDVYLSSRCSFFIGSNEGIIGLPAIFRRPIAFVNLVPLAESQNVTYLDSLFIPKNYYSGEKGRLMTFCEILSHKNLRYGMAFRSDIYGPQRIEVIENTADEIAELTLEMHERIRSEFKPSPEDQELQRRLMAILRAHSDVIAPAKNFHRIIMGAHFLRKYRQLLDGCGHVEAIGQEAEPCPVP